jgi:hypothetical protein
MSKNKQTNWEVLQNILSQQVPAMLAAGGLPDYISKSPLHVSTCSLHAY